MLSYIADIRRVPSERILLLRSIDRILASKEFEEAFNKSNSEQRKNLIIIVYNSDKISLLKWIKNINNSLTFKELQIKAHKLGISNYRHLNKSQLEWRINERLSKT